MEETEQSEKTFTDMDRMKTARLQDLVMSSMDDLVEHVNETRRICKDLLNQGLLSEDKYRTIVAAPSTQDRMKQLFHALSSKGQHGRYALYRLLQEHEPELTLQLVLEQHGMKERDGFYNLLFHCEPLLYRELEKDRVFQMFDVDKENNKLVHLLLEERWRELESNEKQVEKEKEELRKARNYLEKQQAKIDLERMQVLKMKLELKEFCGKQERCSFSLGKKRRE
ncbi:hypothetical protein AMELA_G00273680 [Ameiurus melas]|uniref:CARD domain-containing protein n=1 Tax=Ameiurus melas TaxID=219545 RepID=A0A7J5ZL84_AMEME|nr:hypothetical protein AMELA_G00273680 [Ameiurus melas]